MVVRGRAWSCAAVVHGGRAQSCVVMSGGRAWSCAAAVRGRARRSCAVVTHCRSARFAASTAVTHGRTDTRMDNI